MHEVETFWLKKNQEKARAAGESETEGIKSDPVMLSQIVIKSGTYQGKYITKDVTSASTDRHIKWEDLCFIIKL